MAKGLTLGHRMGIVVGGTWAIAGIFIRLVGKEDNVEFMLILAPIGYILSAFIAIALKIFTAKSFEPPA